MPTVREDGFRCLAGYLPADGCKGLQRQGLGVPLEQSLDQELLQDHPRARDLLDRLIRVSPEEALAEDPFLIVGDSIRFVLVLVVHVDE